MIDFTQKDGWNEEALRETNLMQVFEDAAKMQYEIKNARRGSYGFSGKTKEDMIADLELLRDQLDDAITDIENS